MMSLNMVITFTEASVKWAVTVESQYVWDAPKLQCVNIPHSIIFF